VIAAKTIDGPRGSASLAIETHGLTKAYGEVGAVADLDLEVPTAEVFAFLGPNGAGKSTTIRLLLDLQRATRGRATVLGLDSHEQSVDVHRRIGYLPGDLELHPRMTGRHHLDTISRARGGVDPSVVRALVERFDVDLDRPVRQLSKGNRQKIGLVLTFMSQPELLILDEPTGGLDPLMQEEFAGLLAETVADGRSVFLSSHELDEVQRVADRVAIIKDGRLVVTDTIEGLRRSTPTRIEARFRRPVDRADFARVPGVTVVSCEGTMLVVEHTGEIGPFLRTVVDHDPVDLVSRPIDLDELFLAFYRDDPGAR
jgi:ABC-2 type transport system ATP-binding protein